MTSTTRITIACLLTTLMVCLAGDASAAVLRIFYSAEGQGNLYPCPS